MQLLNLLFLVLLYPVNISTNCINFDKNSCRTWPEYDERFGRCDCRVNPDGDRTLEQIVRSYNYPVEALNVSTRDNYVLTQFRINRNNGPSLLLLHGIYQNGIVWTLKANESLAYILSDAGYDVWLGNVRGTLYSSNTKYNETTREYWDFTPHEMGTIDIPAILEYIYSKNGNKKIQVVAYSMGSTSMLIYSSMMPKHAVEYVVDQTLLAPVATLNDLNSPVKFSPLAWKPFGAGMNTVSQYYILKPSSASKDLAVLAFTPTTANVLTYRNIIGPLFGYSCQMNPDTFHSFIKNGGDAIGISVLEFYNNIVEKKILRALDYGDATLNNKHYGNSTAPIYHLDQINISTSLVYGENDQLATEGNVATLYAQLPPVKCVMKVALRGFCHSDFVNGIDAATLVYYPLVKEVLIGTCVNATPYSC